MSLKNYLQNKRNEIDDQEMSLRADTQFEKRLMKELHQQPKGKLIYLKFISVAASIALLFAFGYWFVQSSTIKKDKNQMVANLTDTSAGARLEGIYHFEDEYKREDDQIISMLIDILHKDSNANVKIASIDALMKFPKNELIRKNMIMALEVENEPLVQIKLIKSLTILRENRAQKSLKKLIDNEETLPIVLNNASMAMAEISQN